MSCTLDLAENGQEIGRPLYWIGSRVCYWFTGELTSPFSANQGGKRQCSRDRKGAVAAPLSGSRRLGRQPLNESSSRACLRRRRRRERLASPAAPINLPLQHRRASRRLVNAIVSHFVQSHQSPVSKNLLHKETGFPPYFLYFQVIQLSI
jgi:hypothetical protein